jgi:hypothetical protein
MLVSFDKTLKINNEEMRKGLFCLRFRDFSPWSLVPITVGLVRQIIMGGITGEDALDMVARKQGGREKYSPQEPTFSY